LIADDPIDGFPGTGVVAEAETLQAPGYIAGEARYDARRLAAEFF
jgi:hypothetical protein